MELENQVCNLGQAIRLKELGITATGLYCFAALVKMTHKSFDGEAIEWIAEYDEEDMELMNSSLAHFDGLPNVSAFTVAELGVMLPGDYPIPLPQHSGGYAIRWRPIIDRRYPTEAQARADYLMFLLETNRTTADEVNARLNA